FVCGDYIKIVHFFSNVLFTDEATFSNHGSINLRNAHYWSVGNLHWLREVDHQRQWSVNVWCGILNGKVIGPYFITGTMTGQKYSEFLQKDLPILLEDVPLQNRYGLDEMVLFHVPVGLVLNQLDFFLWGLLKETAYANAPTTIEDMHRRIITACANITSDVLIRVQHSFRARLQQYVDVNGHHFEHL
ncbi:uncharacterized protein LOC143348242, partial [Colletes latitarsis]|uniref:uncharacterized protein LOC143348242 n=1 Tax=Colletes latitarsis TaxID=2605962 RepID=UPI004035452E